ncbi:hypothetical protein HPB47_008353, partial [Ixodes persulcatus]
ELKEAHLVNQYTRLSQTVSGRRLLDRLHIQHELPELWRHKLWVSPLPRNMDTQTHEGRRGARARALEHQYGSKQGVYYVDVAGPSPTGFYRAAVVHQDQRVNGLSYRAIISVQAEEGLRGNVAADAAARALTHRAPHPGSSGSEIRQPVLQFKEILADYCERHWLFPVPAKGLSGADERTLRRLQTNTLLRPAIVKHFDPKVDGRCPHWGEVSDNFHMVWACQMNPSLPPNPSPTREAWEAALLNLSGLESQRTLVQRARVAALCSGVPD